jgi:hypothetical protein
MIISGSVAFICIAFVVLVVYLVRTLLKGMDSKGFSFADTRRLKDNPVSLFFDFTLTG